MAPLAPPTSAAYVWQGCLNSLKVVGAQLTNKTYFYCEKLNSYEHLKILWGRVPQCPPCSTAYPGSGDFSIT